MPGAIHAYPAKGGVSGRREGKPCAGGTYSA